MWKLAAALLLTGCAIALGDGSTATVNTNTDTDHQLRVNRLKGTTPAPPPKESQ